MTETNQKKVEKSTKINRASFHDALDAVERDIDEWRESQGWWD